MVEIKTAEEANRRYALGSIRAFLDDKKTLNWVLGIIKSPGVRGQRLREVLNRLQDYRNTERYYEIFSVCRDRGWIS